MAAVDQATKDAMRGQHGRRDRRWSVLSSGGGGGQGRRQQAADRVGAGWIVRLASYPGVERGELVGLKANLHRRAYACRQRATSFPWLQGILTSAVNHATTITSRAEASTSTRL